MSCYLSNSYNDCILFIKPFLGKGGLEQLRGINSPHGKQSVGCKRGKPLVSREGVIIKQDGSTLQENDYIGTPSEADDLTYAEYLSLDDDEQPMHKYPKLEVSSVL